MPTFQCPRCDKVLTTKRTLVDHIRNGTVCGTSKVTSQQAEEFLNKLTALNPKKVHKCRYCCKTFTHKNNVYRHEKTHSGKTPTASSSTVTTTNSSSTNVISGNNNTQDNSSTTDNSITIQQCPIIIVSHGKENLSEIIDNNWLRGRGFINETIIKAIKDIHFNPEKPENMNVYISNLKDEVCRVFSDLNIWVRADINDTVDNAYDRVTEHIESILDELDQPNTQFHERWNRFMEKDRAIEVAKEDIKMTLYNLKDLVKKVHGLGNFRKH